MNHPGNDEIHVILPPELQGRTEQETRALWQQHDADLRTEYEHLRDRMESAFGPFDLTVYTED